MASILICDDQPDVVSALHFLLKGAGHKTYLSHSPRSAMETLEANPLDLVLTDMNFTRDTTSGHEGLDLVEQIRRRRDAPGVVVMTAWGDVDLAVQAMRRGAMDFLQKPWDNSRLLATVERCVAGARSARSERDIARNVQQKLLPDRVLELPGLRAVARFEPAQEVGGDYYDFFPLGNGGLGFALADVSGKGVPAALLMANLQALFRAHDAALLAQPAALLERVNRLFYDSTESARFATVFYGVVQAGQLRWANCGHPPATLRRGDGTAQECGVTATVLGMFPHLDVTEGRLTLAPGDSVYVCSDGLLEQDLAEDDRTEIEVWRL